MTDPFVVLLTGLPTTTPVGSALDELSRTSDVVVVSFGPVPGLADRTRVVVVDRPSRRAVPRPVALVRAALELLTARRPTDRFRKAVLAHPDIAPLISRAALIIALDTPAVDVAWHLTRRNQGLRAVVGLAAGRRVLNQA